MMTLQKINIEKLFVSLDETSSGLLKLVSWLDDDSFNTVPFKNSWTAAQVTVHVIKSNLAITKALYIDGKIIERAPDERVDELKDLFLDFILKMRSPEFILPRDDWYIKAEIIKDFMQSIRQLKEESNHINLYEAISHPAFGEITKLELLYFVLFHTQRHIYQLQNILSHLDYKNKSKITYEYSNHQQKR